MRAVIALAVLLSLTLFACAQKPPAQKVDLKAEAKKLVVLEKVYTQAKGASMKAPKDAAKKKAYAKATFVFADTVMNSPALGSKEKYPKALRLFREVVKVDPKYPHAKESVDMLENIYKSMGRPIPH